MMCKEFKKDLKRMKNLRNMGEMSVRVAGVPL